MMMGLPSPEAAFEEYQAAWVQRDIPRFLATINFHQEAVEKLRSGGSNKARSLNEAAVNEAASHLKASLQSLLETKGFVATDIGACKIAKKLPLSDDQVRFVLASQSATSALLMPIRVMRFAGGWQVVRGG